AFMGRGGIDRYAFELFSAILERSDSHSYVLFSMFAPFRHSGLNGAPIRSVLARKAAMAQVELLRRIWSRSNSPSVERFTGPIDVVHTVHHFAIPARVARIVATIHDLSFCYPQFSIEHARRYEADARRTAARADVVVAPSDFTRAELIERFR